MSVLTHAVLYGPISREEMDAAVRVLSLIEPLDDESAHALVAAPSVTVNVIGFAVQMAKHSRTLLHPHLLCAVLNTDAVIAVPCPSDTASTHGGFQTGQLAAVSPTRSQHYYDVFRRVRLPAAARQYDIKFTMVCEPARVNDITVESVDSENRLLWGACCTLGSGQITTLSARDFLLAE